MTPEPFPIFVKLLQIIELKNTEKINRYLTKKVRKLYAKNPDYRGDFDCDVFTTYKQDNLIYDTACTDFFGEIAGHVSTFAKYFGSNYPISCEQAWINLSKPGNYQETHIHTNSHFSVVYYVTAPANSGNIVFINDEIRDMRGLPVNTEPVPFCACSRFVVTPVVSHLLIFRSNIEHYVTKNYSKEDRISVSANFDLLYK